MIARDLGALLRAPGEVARRCRDEEDLASLAATSLAAAAVGCAVYGATLGTFRGGLQIVYAGAKLPAAVAATLALTVPALWALAAASGRAWSLRSATALALAAAGRAALVLLAAAPALWLALELGLGYHAATLVAAGFYALGGAAALGVLLRGLGDAPGRLGVAAATVAVFFATGGQTAWALRPFLVRPQTTEVPFVRATEGSFADALLTSARSTAGGYARPPRRRPAGEHAPAREEW